MLLDRKPIISLSFVKRDVIFFAPNMTDTHKKIASKWSDLNIEMQLASIVLTLIGTISYSFLFYFLSAASDELVSVRSFWIPVEIRGSFMPLIFY